MSKIFNIDEHFQFSGHALYTTSESICITVKYYFTAREGTVYYTYIKLWCCSVSIIVELRLVNNNA